MGPGARRRASQAGQAITVAAVGDEYTSWEGYKDEATGETKIGLSYAKLCQHVKPGGRILLADGSISILVRWRQGFGLVRAGQGFGFVRSGRGFGLGILLADGSIFILVRWRRSWPRAQNPNSGGGVLLADGSISFLVGSLNPRVLDPKPQTAPRWMRSSATGSCAAACSTARFWASAKTATCPGSWWTCPCSAPRTSSM
jgi:hypothetical protein